MTTRKLTRKLTRTNSRTNRRSISKKGLTNKKYFLTYGNAGFKKSRERLNNEALNLNIFDKTIIESDITIKSDDEFKQALKNKNFKKVFNKKRGGGYWIWKPYIVYKHLKKLNNNDILVYADAGCSIKKNSVKKFNETFNKLKKGNKKMMLNKLKPTEEYSSYQLKEKMWTKGDILNYYKVYNNNKILNERQYEANRIFIIKNDKTMEIIKKWWNSAKEHPELFDDSESKKPNKEGFIETRHDQSNISVLCKINGNCLGTDLGFISDSRIKD